MLILTTNLSMIETIRIKDPMKMYFDWYQGSVKMTEMRKVHDNDIPFCL